MNEEEKKELLQKIDNIDKTLTEFNTDFHETGIYIMDKLDIENYQKNHQSDNILSLIFGFLVGYCLIKSFFDGLKV